MSPDVSPDDALPSGSNSILRIEYSAKLHYIIMLIEDAEDAFV